MNVNIDALLTSVKKSMVSDKPHHGNRDATGQSFLTYLDLLLAHYQLSAGK